MYSERTYMLIEGSEPLKLKYLLIRYLFHLVGTYLVCNIKKRWPICSEAHVEYVVVTSY